MTPNEELILKEAVEGKAHIYWIPDSQTARRIHAVRGRTDGEPTLCAYVEGGKPGDYIALYNVPVEDIKIVKPLFES